MQSIRYIYIEVFLIGSHQMSFSSKPKKREKNEPPLVNEEP